MRLTLPVLAALNFGIMQLLFISSSDKPLKMLLFQSITQVNGGRNNRSNPTGVQPSSQLEHLD